jgi:hypothetical protein
MKLNKLIIRNESFTLEFVFFFVTKKNEFSNYSFNSRDLKKKIQHDEFIIIIIIIIII